MASDTNEFHLDYHHRATLRKLLQHPVSHNIEWHSVMSLLNAVGTVVDHHDGRVTATVGAESRILHGTQNKDLDTPAIVDLRRMLLDAGYGGDSADAD